MQLGGGGGGWQGSSRICEAQEVPGPGARVRGAKPSRTRALLQSFFP